MNDLTVTFFAFVGAVGLIGGPTPTPTPPPRLDDWADQTQSRVERLEARLTVLADTLIELDARIDTLESDSPQTPQTTGPIVINAAVGDGARQLQNALPDLKRTLQISPSQIDWFLGWPRVTGSIFDAAIRARLRAKAAARFRSVAIEYHDEHGDWPWGMYADELRVEPYASFNPLELYWLSVTTGEHKGVSSDELLARSDALMATIEQIQAGFNDAAEDLLAEFGAEIVAMQGITSGPKARDPATLASYHAAALDFAQRHPEHTITALIVWDYWVLGADNDTEGFARRSTWNYASNRAAYRAAVVRVFRPVKLDPRGQVVVGANGHAVPWTPDQITAWWDATGDDDPKGIWGIGFGANAPRFNANAPDVAAVMLGRVAEANE